ncbi:MAG: VCBS repeat-containing protein [Planctomycetes bacterium]|nr:VCBS repeat-containing protein [Planctomycetota bacterium]
MIAGWLAAVLLAPQQPDVCSIQVPPHVVITGTLRGDVDGDGRSDLTLACRDTTSGRRELRLHLRSDGAVPFAALPSRPPYGLETDVIAFAWADTTEAPGRELVLCTAERVVAVERDADGAPLLRPLFAHRLVWPAADPDFALPLAEARGDVDGDGRDDLLLPRPDGATWWRPGGAEVELALPPRRNALAGRATRNGNGAASLSRDELQLRLPFGDDDADADRGPLLRVRATAPPFRAIDLDGDGRRDLAAVRNDALFAWLQQADGTFAARELALPLPADRLSLFDPAFDVRCADLDGDRRADLVLTTSARRDDAIEVRIDTFAALAEGGFGAAATGRLRVQALARPPQLVDADGDGALDLVLVTVRVDLLRTLSGDGPQALDAQLLVFRNTGGRFAQPALLQAPLRLPANAEGQHAAFVHVDGGALVAFEEQRLERRPLARDGERLTLLPPTTAWPLPDGARVEPREPDAPTDEVLVRTEHELRVVRLR